MKLQTLGAGIAGCLLAAVISGCDQKTSTPPPSVVAPKPAVESAPAVVQQSAEKVATEVKTATQQAVGEVKQAVAQPAPAVTESTQITSSELTTVLTKAKSQVVEKKYQEALTTLGALKDVKLTDTQQKTVDELKAQIQKYLATSEAGKAVGNLLGK